MELSRQYCLREKLHPVVLCSTNRLAGLRPRAGALVLAEGVFFGNLGGFGAFEGGLSIGRLCFLGGYFRLFCLCPPFLRVREGTAASRRRATQEHQFLSGAKMFRVGRRAIFSGMHRCSVLPLGELAWFWAVTWRGEGVGGRP